MPDSDDISDISDVFLLQTHRKTVVVHQHLAQLPLLLEVVLRVEVIVAVGADTVDPVSGE